MMNRKEATLDKIRNGVIVSCQAVEGNPLVRECSRNMLLMAECAVEGGCAGFRANSPENIRPIKEKYPEYPMIGIRKVVTEGNPVYITPTMKEIDALAECGCEIIALDCTNQINCEGHYAWENIKLIREKYPDIVIMADIDTLEDATIAAREGADIIATTLNGYTANSVERHVAGDSDGEPNYEFLRQLKKADLGCFILYEGRIWTREQAVKCFEEGADCICIGKAITNPYKITDRFVKAVNGYFGK
ncbi:MAG: putative N-acetylmannosamine-6-phosphate 2-epimerase [Erysipelotrichaceae bacterium]|nr:putative N-acetylmannosamine-6-phosphate 2-epimerase [Erysipelotrichaceae bacterium]